ncbi:MAG: hypothetical protein HY549_12895 [Elusimicrobia bacterium]|nr:hypothetical protein [Elusimicrobiota bacterium]
MKALALAVLAAGLGGCVGYPKFYWTTRKGQTTVTPGRPVMVRADLVKSCDTVEGEQDQLIRSRMTQADGEGRYRLRIWGAAWNWRNLISHAECRSRVQMFVCREPDYCRPVDDVELEVLGR